MNRKKIAILGVCNSREILNLLNEELETVFYGFQNCFIDITGEGLGIPYKDFYTTPTGKNEYADFTKQMMYCDLNKTSLKTIESKNPDYLLIDLSSVAFSTYLVGYNGKTVYSNNGFCKKCYSVLQTKVPITFEKVILSSEVIRSSLNVFSNYLKENWDLSKIILFSVTKPEYYVDFNTKEIKEFPQEFYMQKRIDTISKVNDFFIRCLNYPNLKIFHDADIKVCQDKQDKIPSMFHCEENTRKYQSLLFKRMLFKNVSDEELNEAKNKVLNLINN